MCMSQPDPPKAPDPIQESKTPDFQAQRDARRKRALAGGGTMLTGPSGIENAAASMGKPTLLGQ